MVLISPIEYKGYHINLKYWNKQAWEIGVDLEQTPQNAKNS